MGRVVRVVLAVPYGDGEAVAGTSELREALAGIGLALERRPLERLASTPLGRGAIVLVDWREERFDLPPAAAAVPLVALVDPRAPPAEIALAVDELVAEAELRQPLFASRATRLLERYATPLSLSSRERPELALVQALVDASSDWIFVKDLEHRFLFVSEAFARSNGMRVADIVGRTDLEIGFNETDVLGEPELDWPGFWPQDDAVVRSGERAVEENAGWRALLNQRRRRTIRVPLKNAAGEVYALLVCCAEIHGRDAEQLDIRRRSDMLESVLDRMHAAQESRLRAELAERAKNKLLAAASHDLRQPLHAVGLFLDVLERRASGEAELQIIAKIKRSNAALARLFNSMLDISRLDAGVVESAPRHFAIDTLLANLRAEYIEIGARKSLGVAIHACDAVVRTDPVLLERILRNLVQNAVTYTRAGSVVVECSRLGHALAITVSDTGPGIPASEHTEVFSEYYQLDDRTQSSTEGLGLGLAIVRRLVDLLGLEIGLGSEVGRGSCFTVSVPLGEPSEVSRTGTIESAVELDGQTILIVDDEAEILEAMRAMLDSHRCRALVAESAERAVALLVEHDVVPDLIIADYRLGGGQTGDAAIRRIREELNAELPAVIITGDTSADRLRDATTSGFQLLHKPVQPAQLLNVIAATASTASPA